MTERQKVAVGESVLSTQFETTFSDTADKTLMEQTLIYLGQDGRCFTLGYREFNDGSARGPFREDATYQKPLPGETTEIAYRKARFRVYAVSNADIDFELLAACERI